MRLDPQRLQYWAHWYLSEVWLEQAERRRNGAYVKYPVCEPEAWNGDFYQVRPRPDEAIITRGPLRWFRRRESSQEAQNSTYLEPK